MDLMINETTSCKCRGFYVILKNPLFCVLEKCDIMTAKMPGRKKAAFYSLISCGQQPKIIKTCAAAVTQRV